VATLATGPGGTARINEDHPHLQPLSFVLDKLNKLTKRPTTDHAVEAFAAVDPIANTIQSFKADDGIIIPIGQLHNALADHMVEMGHPTSFLLNHTLSRMPTTHQYIILLSFKFGRRCRHR
jgi:hypothetical protein